MKVLISGAGGFAGRTFLSRLYGTDAWDEQARTWRVVGQVRSRVPYIEGAGLAALSGRLTFDTRPPSPANRVCDGCDLVINFAARTFRDYLDRDPAPFFRDNVAHVADLLADARACGVRRLIHLSTDEVYPPLGPNDPPHPETARLAPAGPYAASKAAADMLVLGAEEICGVVLRTQNLYGPGQASYKVLPRFVAAALAGEGLPLFDGGIQSRRWLWAGDLAEAVMRLALAPDPSGVYHAAGVADFTTRQIADTVLAALGLPPDQIRLLPGGRIGQNALSALDIGRLSGEYGWVPTVPPEAGFAQAARWYARRSGHESESASAGNPSEAKGQW